MNYVKALIVSALVFSLVSVASAQQLQPPPTDKPAAAPAPKPVDQQQAKPATPPAPPTAQQQARPSVNTNDPCPVIADLKPADTGFKEVKVRRPVTGVQPGRIANVIVPPESGATIDGGAPETRIIKDVRRCPNGVLVVEARITAVTPQYEEITFLVPSTAPDFAVRSCSMAAGKKCADAAEGFVKGSFEKPIVLGSYVAPTGNPWELPKK